MDTDKNQNNNIIGSGSESSASQQPSSRNSSGTAPLNMPDKSTPVTGGESLLPHKELTEKVTPAQITPVVTPPASDRINSSVSGGASNQSAMNTKTDLPVQPEMSSPQTMSAPIGQPITPPVASKANPASSVSEQNLPDYMKNTMTSKKNIWLWIIIFMVVVAAVFLGYLYLQYRNLTGFQANPELNNNVYTEQNYPPAAVPTGTNQNIISTDQTKSQTETNLENIEQELNGINMDELGKELDDITNEVSQ